MLKMFTVPQTCRTSFLLLPVVWGCHFMFPFLQWSSSLTPFLAAALHLSYTPYCGIRCQKRSVEFLHFWWAAPGTSGLAPAHPHTPVSSGAPCFLLGRLCKLPLCGAQVPSKDFPMRPYGRPQSVVIADIYNVTSNFLQLNLLCNSRLLLVPHCQIVRGLTELWVNLHAEALELSTAISPITKCKLQLLVTKLILLIAVC